MNDPGYNSPEGRPLSSHLSAKFLTADLSSFHTEMCLLSNNVNDYYFVSQGKTTIPNVDDGEECTLTDVRLWRWRWSQDSRLLFTFTTLEYLRFSCWPQLTVFFFFWINHILYHVAWRNCNRQFVTPLERGIVGETCLSRSIFSDFEWCNLIFSKNFIAFAVNWHRCLLIISNGRKSNYIRLHE